MGNRKSLTTDPELLWTMLTQSPVVIYLDNHLEDIGIIQMFDVSFVTVNGTHYNRSMYTIKPR